MVIRNLEKIISKRIFRNKAIVIFGARQVGKTTLVNKLISDIKEPVIVFNGDEGDTSDILVNTTSTRLKSIIGKNKLVVIDEAQKIENIGLTIKLIVDNLKDVQVIATGSSAFELSNKINEPLTGRKYEYYLFPFLFQELSDNHGLLEEKRMLEHRLVFGSYPEIVNRIGEEKEHLKLIASSYLYKDLLMLDQIKKPVLLEKILKALALQIGNEVKYKELGDIVGADNETIEKYIDLLEKTYIIFRLESYSRNVRNEIRKGKKIYFIDNGIRNAIIGNYNYLESRTDVGALWENFFISERFKLIKSFNIDRKMFFWRTTQQQEIDLVEEENNTLSSFEIKWNPKRKARQSKTFQNAYNNPAYTIINKNNYFDLLLHPEK